MRKKIDKNVITSSTIAIAAAFIFEYLVRKSLPVDSPYLWLSWLALPLAFVVQRTLLKELNKRWALLVVGQRTSLTLKDAIRKQGVAQDGG